MNSGYTEQIRERIINAPDGSVFVNSDFADIADNNTIKQSISRWFERGFCAVLSGEYLISRNTANFLRNMWRRIRMRLPKHWRDAIIGQSLHVETRH